MAREDGSSVALTCGSTVLAPSPAAASLGRPPRRNQGGRPTCGQPLTQGEIVPDLSHLAQPFVVSERTLKRFWSRVGPTTISGCFPWLGPLRLGYGSFSYMSKSYGAHRFAYMLAHRTVPIGLHVDHLCRNRSCVNVDHLEAVIAAENVLRGASPRADNARKVTCPQGHMYDYMSPKGERGCKTCRRASAEKFRAQRRPWVGRGR